MQSSHNLKSFPLGNRNLVFWFWYYCHYSGWIYSLSTLTYWPLSLNLKAVISLKVLFLHSSAALLIKWMMSAHDDFIINVLSRKLQWCIDFNIVMKWVRQVIMIGEELQAGDLTSPHPSQSQTTSNYRTQQYKLNWYFRRQHRRETKRPIEVECNLSRNSKSRMEV